MSCTEIIHQSGYRLTPQRMMIIEVLHNVNHHVSAEEIFAKLKSRYPYANISTVYRTLELMKKLGLLTEIDIGDGCIRYHLLEKGHHHHLICNNCGKIFNLPESLFLELQSRIKRDYKFNANLRHMAIFGVCSDCQSSKKS